MSKRRKWFIAIPLILFVMLAICIQAKLSVPLESWAYSETVEGMSPVLTSVMKGFTFLGESAVVITFCLALFIVSKLRKTVALPVSTAVILSGICNVALKHLFARNRPNILRLINETGYSFPSGHAMINASLYVILILLICRYFKNKFLKTSLCAICIMLIVMIGYSRIYLGVHYAGDVLAGWLFGSALSMMVYFRWDNKLSLNNQKTALAYKDNF